MLNQQKSPLVTNQAQLLSSPTQIRFQNQAGFNQILQPGAAAAAMSMNQFQVSINRFEMDSVKAQCLILYFD